MTVRFREFSYSLEVWLTSVLVAPIIYILVYDLIIKKPVLSAYVISNLFNEYFFCVLFSGLFSAPTWILFFLLIKVLILFYVPGKIIRQTVAVIGLILTIGTFALLLPEALHSDSEFFTLLIANCICISAGSLIYRIETQDELLIA